MSKLKLKPCPFCGGEAETENRRNRYTDWWEVKCTDCNASINERYDWEFQAVEAWNTRKPMDMVEAELESIKTGGDCRHKCKYYDWSVGWCDGHCEDYVREKALEIVRNAGKEKEVPQT